MQLSIDASDRVERVDHVGPLQDLGPGARNRFVVRPERIERQSPFVLLVEDFIAPGADFHPHPHRGFETVTFVLDGAMDHADSAGTEGVAAAGDVLWMTAGSGIVHGGRPVGSRPVHALQLWMALPQALRASAPGTREQPQARALLRHGENASARVYGAASVAVGDADWSRWPMTLTDVSLEQAGRFSLALRGQERSFLYVLDGTVSVDDGAPHKAGEILWFAPSESDAAVVLRASDGARCVHYSAVPIAEPIVTRGPFVMGSEAELAAAFADLRSGRFRP